jgi:hypothetical protein
MSSGDTRGLTQEALVLAGGDVEAISKEGDFGAPPGFCWVMVAKQEYLAEMVLGFSLRVGEHVKFAYRSTRAGPQLVQFLQEPSEERIEARPRIAAIVDDHARSDVRCFFCGRDVSELPPFGGLGDPLMGDFTGAKLVKHWRGIEYKDEKGKLIQFETCSTWECRDCIVKSDDEWLAFRLKMRCSHTGE